MIIKFLKLHNFRQFVGNQIINFSEDPNKKVTIVIAESGVGKTTLIQAFQWIMYGESKYNTPLNGQIKESMIPNSIEEVWCSMSIDHKDKNYTIKRKQLFKKINVQVQIEPSILTVDEKDENGISHQTRGRDAEKIIKEIMQKDLFSYFFLEGENLTRVGEQMSKGKAGANSEFAKAIKGLLGFNYLYDTTKHLSSVIEEYQLEISKNSNDPRLSEIIKQIASKKQEIEKNKNRLETIKEEIGYNQHQREEYNTKIVAFSEVEDKQKRTKAIEKELISLDSQINNQKKYLLKKFSNNACYLVMNELIKDAEETLKDSDSLDKGIPGINVDAIKFMLENHKCVCGNDVHENTKEWETLTNWINFLPPNNIGFEIERFNDDLKSVKKNSDEFVNDFEKARKDLNNFIEDRKAKYDELEKLNEEIGSVSEDVSKLKERENEYNQKIIDLNIEKASKESNNEILSKEILNLEEEQRIYRNLNERVSKFTSYKDEAEFLKNRILKFCKLKEAQKRQSLENAINEIFKNFYNEKIIFSVDSNYGVQIKTSNTELSDDFTSGGQDVAVALAFIGAIIKLNKVKDNDPDNIADDFAIQAYPLIMDAPTSNFGMRQMDSFSEIMPKITDQIIVFINDKDGPILRRKMFDKIGSEWIIEKKDTYHSNLKEGSFNGKI